MTFYGLDVFLVEDGALMALGGGKVYAAAIREEATPLPIHVEGGNVAGWQRTEEIEFARLPLVAGTQEFSGRFAMTLRTTAGVIEAPPHCSRRAARRRLVHRASREDGIIRAQRQIFPTRQRQTSRSTVHL